MGFTLDYLRLTNIKYLIKLYFLNEYSFHKKVKQHDLKIDKMFKTEWINQFIAKQKDLYK